jgi:ribosomal protein S18 acetylase RimI-like enzyme
VSVELREADRRADLSLLRSIASEALTRDVPRYTIHPGDIAWWVCHEDPRLADSTSYWLWDDSGFVVVSKDEISAFTRPGLDVIPLIEWARIRLGGKGTLGWVSDADSELVGYLSGRGDERVEAMHLYRMDLSPTGFGRADLPDGWVLRPLSGEGEALARREASYRAFASTMDPAQHLERYLRFMRSAVYDPERDLVAVAPDGRIAGFVIWWPDSSGIAQIEPFGTHPDFQRQGVGRALIEYAFARMSAAGMRAVRVCTETTREPAATFYPAVGFVAVDRLGWWRPSA